MVSTVREPARDLPVVAKADVLVVGGGTAGLAAAVAAGRSGADVMLLERYGYVGGACSGGLVLTLPRDRQGVFTHELEERLYELKAASRPDDWFGTAWDPEMLKWLGLTLLEEAKVRLLFQSWAVGAIHEDGVIKGIITESKAGRRAVLADVVVDCTGDADIAAFVGAPFMVGDGQGRTMGVTMMFLMLGVDEQRYPGDVRPFHPPLSTSGVFTRVHPGELNVWGGMAEGVDCLDPAELTRAENELRKQVVQWAEWAKATVPGCEKAHLSLTSPQLGIRETRRIEGEHVLAQADWAAGQVFPDHIGFAYEGKSVPYRSLLPKGVDNLLVAGRCASFAHNTQDEMRIIPPCMVTGFAAGVAAAEAVARGVRPRALPIDALQQALRQRGVS